MTSACCPSCRLRMTAATAAQLSACPECGEPLQPMNGLAQAVGYRLFVPQDVPGALPETTLPEAIAVSMPIPSIRDPQTRGS